MCGNFFSDPIGTVGNEITDIAQNPWPTLGTVAGSFFGPVGAAIGNEVGDFASQGPSNFIKNAGSNAEGAALAGAADYGIGQLTAAGGQAFPETAASINGAIPNLGITDAANSISQSLGFGGSVPSGVSTGGGTFTDPTSAVTNPALQPSGVSASTPSAGVSGGGASGGASAPSSLTPDTGDVTNQFAQGLGGSNATSWNTGTQLGGLVNNTGDLSGVGTAASSSNLLGTPGVGESGTFNVNNPSGSTSLSDLGSNAPPNYAGGKDTGLLSPVTNAFSGPQSADTLAANNETFNNLPSTNLTGGASSDQSASLTSAGQAANSPAPAGGPAAKAPNSIGALFQDGGLTLGNVGTALANNIAPLAAAGGIGLDALKGNPKSGAQLSQNAIAAQEQGQGAQLENYLQTGTLPAGEQAGVNQALQSAIASIKSQYASMGMSGSSAEQQDIANAQSQAQAASAQMQEQLLSTGINETGMSSQLYSELLKNQMASDTNLSNAVANFASAAGGGGNFGKGGQTITIGGA